MRWLENEVISRLLAIADVERVSSWYSIASQ